MSDQCICLGGGGGRKKGGKERDIWPLWRLWPVAIWMGRGSSISERAWRTAGGGGRRSFRWLSAVYLNTSQQENGRFGVVVGSETAVGKKCVHGAWGGTLESGLLLAGALGTGESDHVGEECMARGIE